jgi:hypothetical protein
MLAKLKGFGNCLMSDHEILTRSGFMNLATVQAHFQKHDALEVACFVDGALVYRSISHDDVITAKGHHSLVSFQAADMKGDNTLQAEVSLLVTANHNMWVRLGRTNAGRIWPAKEIPAATGGMRIQTQEEAAPAWKLRSAESIIASASADSRMVAQFSASFPRGFTETEGPLPFVDALGLQTEDHINAFLELYGYWLGNGWLMHGGRIYFRLEKPQDFTYLDGLFTRLVAVLPQVPHGGEGVWIGSRPPRGQQRSYIIYHSAWVEYFGHQYGHKYQDAEGKRQYYPRDPAEPDRIPTPSLAEGIKSTKCLWNWVLRCLNMAQLRCILTGLRFADGDQANGSRESGIIFTSSARFRDEIVQVALHAGFSATFVAESKVEKQHGVNKQGKAIITRNVAWRVQYAGVVQVTQPKLTVKQECRSVRAIMIA